ncbi:MAG: hypothetical protein ACI4QN_00445 [Candidatus Coproplasma sp.]
MKKIFMGGICCFCLAASCLSILPSCKKNVDYLNYVSENRRQVYLCKEDGYELKIFCSDRETPYCADGVKGNMATICEVYYKCNSSPSCVNCEVEGFSGEMSYMSVTNSFYLSFSADTIEEESLNVKLTIDGKEKEISVRNVFEAGTIDYKSAINSVIEYDKDKFDGLTQRNQFLGEIAIRLIYDDGCYYYVSVCDRNKQVKAYLVDGRSGRIITERESSAE